MISKYIFILGLFWHTNFIGTSMLFFEGHCPIPQMQKRTQRKGGGKSAGSKSTAPNPL
jgi:hypothetical protein